MLIRTKHTAVNVPKSLGRQNKFTFEPMDELPGWYFGDVPDNVAAYLFNVAKANSEPDFVVLESEEERDEMHRKLLAETEGEGGEEQEPDQPARTGRGGRRAISS